MTATMLVDAVIAFTLVELIVLVLLHSRTGRGVAPKDFLLNALSGLCLMLTLRVAVAGLPVVWIAAGLLAAGLAHGADVRSRWRRPPPS